MAQRARKPKAAVVFGFEGHGATKTAARREAEKYLSAFVADAQIEPTLAGFRGRLAVVWRTALNWAYKIVDPAELGPTGDVHRASTHGYADRLEALAGAVSHMAQQAWDHDVADDAAFVAEAFPLARAGTEAARRADDLARWIRFQRSYRMLRDQGLSDAEAHRRAVRD